MFKSCKTWIISQVYTTEHLKQYFPAISTHSNIQYNTASEHLLTEIQILVCIYQVYIVQNNLELSNIIVSSNITKFFQSHRLYLQNMPTKTNP